MADEKRKWKQFQKIKFDHKKFSKHAKKAESVTMRHAHKFIVGRLDNMRDVRRHIIGWLLLAGAMIVIVTAQMSWFQNSYQTAAPTSGGTYAEASLGPIETLNPLYASSNAENAANQLLFSSLYKYDETGNLQNDLAKTISTDETGTVYTVKLRPDVLWHDGKKVTAKDVSFTINLIKNPATRSPLRSDWQDVTAKAIDDSTVQFKLAGAYAAFKHALRFAVLPEHILGSVDPSMIRENTFSRNPVGSGPYSFRLLQNVEREALKVVNMTAFKDYYKGTPMINRFEIHAFGSSEKIMNALRIGQVSAAADLAPGDVQQVNKNNYNITSRPINSGVYALLNVDSPILEKKDVRRALQLATNTNEIRQGLPADFPALDLPFIDGQLSGDDIPHAPAYDSSRAAQLLDKAGWKLIDGVRKNKSGEALTLSVATIKSSMYEKTLEIIAGQWRQLGVDVKTNVIDTADQNSNFVRDILQPRNYDVLLYEQFIGADPDVYAYWHSSQASMNGFNFSNYKNTTADAALASARSRVETDLRNVKYKAFANEWINDVPAIGLYQTVAQYVSSNDTKSMHSDMNLISAYDRYANIMYWSVNTEQVYKTP